MDKLDISYGVFLYLYKKKNKFFNITDKISEIIIATLYRFSQRDILYFEKDKIIFKDYQEIQDKLNLMEENEKRIYKFIRNFVNNNILNIAKLNKNFKDILQYSKEQLIDIETEIENDRDLLKRKTRKEYTILIEQSINDALKFIIDTPNKETKKSLIEHYVIINILIGNYNKVTVYLDNLSADMKTPFFESLNYFKEFIDVENMIINEENKEQISKRAIHVSPIQAYFGSKH